MSRPDPTNPMNERNRLFFVAGAKASPVHSESNTAGQESFEALLAAGWQIEAIVPCESGSITAVYVTLRSPADDD